MRAIWKGTVAFGLVTVPVRVYSAVEDHDLDLHQVHDADGGRIRYERRCQVCGEQVDHDHIDKAYEHGPQTVILTEEDLGSLPEEASKEIEVLQFVPSTQIDPIMLDRSYYLAPEAAATKPYALLRQALSDTDLTAVVRFTLRRRTRLAALRVRGDVLTLQRLRWDDEVREPDFDVDLDVEVSRAEVSMAADLVSSLRADFTPEAFTDDYAEQLDELVEAKLEEGEAVDTGATFGEEEATSDGAEVVDLMDALRQSVERARQGRGSSDDTGTDGGAADKPAADRSAAKKPAGRKSTAKSTATKSTGKKSTATKSTGKKSTATKSTGKKSTGKKSTGKKSTGKGGRTTQRAAGGTSRKSA